MGLGSAAIAGAPADHAVSAAEHSQGGALHRRCEGAQSEQRMVVDAACDGIYHPPLRIDNIREFGTLAARPILLTMLGGLNRVECRLVRHAGARSRLPTDARACTHVAGHGLRGPRS